MCAKFRGLTRKNGVRNSRGHNFGRSIWTSLYREPCPPVRIIFLTAQNIIWCQQLQEFSVIKILILYNNTIPAVLLSSNFVVNQNVDWLVFVGLLLSMWYIFQYFPIRPLEYVVLSFYLSTTVGTPTIRPTWASLRTYEYFDTLTYYVEAFV